MGPSNSARVRHTDEESGKLPVVARGQENRDSLCQPLVLLASIKLSQHICVYNAAADLALNIAVALCESSSPNNESRVVHNAKNQDESQTVETCLSVIGLTRFHMFG